LQLALESLLKYQAYATFSCPRQGTQSVPLDVTRPGPPPAPPHPPVLFSLMLAPAFGEVSGSCRLWLRSGVG